ncbi:MAG: tetratricopeptide repeat protein [Polyangiaceae bacterium]|nr:tetratricopeptide repeat protein [Polyangiaceae bacterium]
MRHTLALGFFSATALISAIALAGPKEDARAVQLFEQAETEYQAGRFAKAVELLLEAQRIGPDPVLHYNLARAYEGMGDLERALASYKAYLDADPSSKDRGATEARIKSLEQLLEERKKAAESPTDTTEKRPPPIVPAEERSPSPVPWVIAGVGALGFGAAGALGALCLSKSSEAEDPETSGADAVRLQDEASTFALGANVAFGVAGAVLAAGVVWGIVDVASVGSSDDTTTALTIDFTGTGLRLRGQFD